MYNHGFLAELVAKFLIKKIKLKDIFIRQRYFKKLIFFMCLQKKTQHTFIELFLIEVLVQRYIVINFSLWKKCFGIPKKKKKEVIESCGFLLKS